MVFYFWIFRSLSTTIEQLTARKQQVKLSLYIKFQRVLLSNVAIALGFSIYYMFIIVAGEIQQQWESRWIYDGLWDVVYFLILLPIMFLFRPTKNSQRFEYSQVADSAYDDEEYGDNLEDSIAMGNGSSSKHSKDVVDEVEEVLNSVIDAKPMQAKKD